MCEEFRKKVEIKEAKHGMKKRTTHFLEATAL
jgi:hypothetical protein